MQKKNIFFFETIFFSRICNFMKRREYINNAFSTQNEVTKEMIGCGHCGYRCSGQPKFSVLGIFFLCCEYFSCF